MNRHNCHLLAGFTLIATISFVAGCAKQSAPSDATAPETQTASPPNARSSNVRAYIDPATGQLREPTREELAQEAAAEAAKKNATVGQNKPTELKEVQLPSGAVAIELGDSAQQPLKACTQPDGQVKMDHECEPESARKK